MLPQFLVQGLLEDALALSPRPVFLSHKVSSSASGRRPKPPCRLGVLSSFSIFVSIAYPEDLGKLQKSVPGWQPDTLFSLHKNDAQITFFAFSSASSSSLRPSTPP